MAAAECVAHFLRRKAASLLSEKADACKLDAVKAAPVHAVTPISCWLSRCTKGALRRERLGIYGDARRALIRIGRRPPKKKCRTSVRLCCSSVRRASAFQSGSPTNACKGHRDLSFRPDGANGILANRLGKPIGTRLWSAATANRESRVREYTQLLSSLVCTRPSKPLERVPISILVVPTPASQWGRDGLDEPEGSSLRVGHGRARKHVEAVAAPRNGSPATCVLTF